MTTSNWILESGPVVSDIVEGRGGAPPSPSGLRNSEYPKRRRLTIFPAGAQNYVNLHGGQILPPAPKSRKLLDGLRRNKRHSMRRNGTSPCRSKMFGFFPKMGTGTKNGENWVFFWKVAVTTSFIRLGWHPTKFIGLLTRSTLSCSSQSRCPTVENQGCILGTRNGGNFGECLGIPGKMSRSVIYDDGKTRFDGGSTALM